MISTSSVGQHSSLISSLSTTAEQSTFGQFVHLSLVNLLIIAAQNVNMSSAESTFHSAVDVLLPSILFIAENKLVHD